MNLRKTIDSTGENAVQFSQYAKQNYDHIYALESDPANIDHMEKRFSCSGIDRYSILPVCAWDKKESLHFSGGLEHTSNITMDESSMEVQADTIDHLLKGKKVTFLKMDVEGAERCALLGAQDLIRRQKPRLAISVYHKREDYFELPLLIKELNPGYRFYLRNYTDTAADTVLYAV